VPFKNKIQFHNISDIVNCLLPPSHSVLCRFHMDQKYPELFRPREASADFSVLNPCATAAQRFSRVRDLSLTSLGPPTASSNLPSLLRVPHCSAIHAPTFYKAFNSYSRDLYEFRRANKLPTPTLPIIFDLSGRLISDKTLKRFGRKGLLFGKMPSSCRDIRKNTLSNCL
jgi:hypothetical protein